MSLKREQVLQILSSVAETHPLRSSAHSAFELVTQEPSSTFSDHGILSKTGSELAELYRFRADSLLRRKGLSIVGLDETVNSLSHIVDRVAVLVFHTKRNTIDIFLRESSEELVGCLVFPPEAE